MDEDERKAQELSQTLTIAQMVKLSDELDLDVLRTMLREQTTHVGTIMPMMDPTRWMREHKGLEAVLEVCQAALDFARVVRANKNPAVAQQASRDREG